MKHCIFFLFFLLKCSELLKYQAQKKSKTTVGFSRSKSIKIHKNNNNNKNDNNNNNKNNDNNKNNNNNNSNKLHCTRSWTEVHVPKHLYCPLPGTHNVHGGRSLAYLTRLGTDSTRTYTPLLSTTGTTLSVCGPENFKTPPSSLVLPFSPKLAPTDRALRDAYFGIWQPCFC